MTQQYPVTPPKSVGTAYILFAFFGLLGVHQFYLGKVGRGLSMLFTFGWLGIGMFVDLFTIEGQVIQANRKAGIAMRYELIQAGRQEKR